MVCSQCHLAKPLMEQHCAEAERQRAEAERQRAEDAEIL